MALKKRTGPSPEEMELARILSLPVEEMLSLEDLEVFNFDHLLAVAYDRGDRLKLEQATAMRAFEEHGGGFLPLAVGKGKCLCGSTEINDLKTGRRLAQDVGRLRVDSMDDGTGKFHPQDGVAFESGLKQCVRLALQGGQQIELSGDHPAFTPAGWMMVGDLVPNDMVAVPRRLPEPDDPCDVADDDVKLLAYLLADGCFAGSHCDFVDECPDTLSEVRILAETKGWSVTDIPQNSKASGMGFGNGARDWAREWGLEGKKSIDKRLPAALYNMPARQCAMFLNRFWACDGHIAPSHLECTLASHGLIRDLRHLLLRLGILGRVRYKTAKCQGKEFDAWRLTISSEEAVKFLEIVGVPPGQDARVDDFLVCREGITPNPNVDVIPFSMREFKEMCDELGIQGRGGCWRKKASSDLPSRGELKKFLGITDGQWISRVKWESFVETYDYDGKFSWLATNDLMWERVESIVSIGKHPVYDLSVDATHSFIANGMVVHNTGVAIFVANHAFTHGIKKVLLLMPVQNVSSLLHRHIPEWRRRINVSIPFHFLAGRSADVRRTISRSNAPGCYVMPFSLLSCSDTVEVLDAIAPELVVVDEVHNLKHAKSARSKRILSYIRKHGPQMVGMSGTITQKSLMDYHHLISAALGDGSPLPRTHSMTSDWDSVVNAQAEEPDGNGQKVMQPLLSWAREETGELFDPDDTESYRRAFRHRLITCPGVVASHEDDLGVSLTFHNEPVPDHEHCEGWTELKQLMDDAEDYHTPQGEEIAHAFHRYKWMLELSAGFWNALEWPTAESIMKGRHVDARIAEQAIDLAQLHHAAQQIYYSWLRKFFKRSPAGLDTPREVGRTMMLADKKGKPDPRIPIPVLESWHDMKDLERACKDKFGFLPERRGRPVRVCDYKIRHAVEWAKENEHGIMWVWHREVGRWLHEALVEAGLDAVHCPAGQQFDRLIESIGDHELGGKGDRLVVASISAHGTGKNLQAFDRACFVQWPRSGKDGEQAVGRIHRYGQKADHVQVTSHLTIEFDHVVRGACISDAVYVQQTTGASQKVVYGDYDPLPLIYSEQFLCEQGIENVQTLSAEGRRIRTENFGESHR